MGSARNLTEEERRGHKEISWDDKEVCGFYMVKFCPHDLFVNTRSDLGPCPKIHDSKLKESTGYVSAGATKAPETSVVVAGNVEAGSGASNLHNPPTSCCLQDDDILREQIGIHGIDRRKHIPDTTEDSHNINTLTTQIPVKGEEVSKDGTFLKKDGPKIIALIQQAELLSSLALIVHTEKTEGSYENACKAVEDFLKKTKEISISDMDIRSCDEGSQQSWRQPDLYQGSPESSEYSTGSTVLSQVIEKMEPQTTQVIKSNCIVEGKVVITPDSTTNQDILASCGECDNDVGRIYPLPNSEFNSPLQVTPLFRSMAAGIPSALFSESERNFLLKTLGMESTPPPKPGIRNSQPPPCKMALLHCL